MSDKKGKDGEHGTLALLAIAALEDNRLEVMRFSETNVPDMGQDIFLTASNNWINQLGELTVANYQPHEKFKTLADDSTRYVRIDVKTSELIDKTLVQKTAADVKKHPKTDTHILFGGTLTPAGEKALQQVKHDYPSKEILHISDNGIKALTSKLDVPMEKFFPHIKIENQEKEQEKPKDENKDK